LGADFARGHSLPKPFHGLLRSNLHVLISLENGHLQYDLTDVMNFPTFSNNLVLLIDQVVFLLTLFDLPFLHPVNFVQPRFFEKFLILRGDVGVLGFGFLVVLTGVFFGL
jgi:hypothetical protein